MTVERHDEDWVRTAHAAFYAAFEAGDLDAMARLWVDDESALCIHPGVRPLQGSDRIHRGWAVIMATTPYIQFILTDVDVRVHGDVAYVTCTENVLVGDGAADAPTEGFRSGLAVATHVMVREDDDWRLWVRHASPVVSAVDHEH